MNRIVHEFSQFRAKLADYHNSIAKNGKYLIKFSSLRNHYNFE